MKKLFLVSMIVFCGFYASAQISRFMMFSAGFSFLTDMTVTNSHLEEMVDAKTGNTCYESFQTVQWNFVSGIFSARMMLLPMTENSSITLSAMPSVNVGAMYSCHDLGSRYGLNVTVPVFAELNIGSAARYVSSAKWGMVFGAGFEYFYSPVASYALTNTEYTNSDYADSWFFPTAKIGIRYLSKKIRVNEIILKVGIGEKLEDFYTFDSKLSKQYRPMHFGMSFLKVLNF